MSRDFALLKVCSHEVFIETIQLDGQGRTAKFLRPPSSSRVTLYVDGVQIPRTGLFSTPTIVFSKPEPYTIRRNVNDLMFIKIGSGIPRFVPIISGNRLRASDITSDLKSKLPNLDVSASSGRVVIQSKFPMFGTAFSFPDPRWTDTVAVLPTTARTLAFFDTAGVPVGLSITGRKIFPSWDIVNDPAVTFDDTEKIIKFSEPVLNQDAFLQVNYVTNASNCRRCEGIRIEFDYNIIGNTYETIRDADLLAQEFDKFLFTKIGSHFKWNWLGSNLINRVGSKSNAGGVAITATLTSDISQAFRTYQNVKTQQEQRFSFQNITDAEFPYSLNNIDVLIPPDDPTIAIVSVDISTRSQEPITLKRIVGNPSPFTLAQDPNLLIRLNTGSDFLLRG